MLTAYTGSGKTQPNIGTGIFIPVTNAIESLNRVIRKSIKTRGSFPTEEAATKLIYLAIRNFEKGGRNVREWFAARNQFAIMFDERFNA
ncbi:MAG: transposase [Nioella sp.]